MSEYSFASKSALKLKGVENPIKKKKKHKKDKERKEKEREAAKETLQGSEAAGGSGEGSSSDRNMNGEDYGIYKKKTAAELAYLKRKEEKDIDRIKKKADLNHKEKVEKFNQYLNGLSEHYDIQKVSWTK